MPFLALPPPSLGLGGWRDPFVIATPSSSESGEYVMLIGSGVTNRGGETLVYRSKHLTYGARGGRASLCVTFAVHLFAVHFGTNRGLPDF